MVVVVVTVCLLTTFVFHCNWVTSNAYSNPNIALFVNKEDGSRQTIDDFREAYHWLSHNTPDDAHVMSWWDYGYQIAGMANRTTIIDNNTWNNSHIAVVARAMAAPEDQGYRLARSLGADYILVIFGGVIGYHGDDINKFIWMVRIAEGEHPRHVRERDFLTPKGEFRVDDQGARRVFDSLLYKLSYYRFDGVQIGGLPAGYDRARNVVMGKKHFQLKYLEEAYTTEHWLVRIYRVKKESEFNRPRIPLGMRKIKRTKVFVSKKTARRRRGNIRRPTVIKGKKKKAET